MCFFQPVHNLYHFSLLSFPVYLHVWYVCVCVATTQKIKVQHLTRFGFRIYWCLTFQLQTYLHLTKIVLDYPVDL